MANRKFQIISVAYIIFLLDSAGLESQELGKPR